MSITDFLLARIADDETLARAALIGIHGKHETSRDYADYVLSSERDTTEAQDEFIETFWPAHVLAECEAKRAIVADVIHSDEETRDYVIRALAAVYADHEDYQDEWKVKG